MSILDNTRKQLNEIQTAITKNSDQTRKQIAEIKANKDFTEQARRKKAESLERARDKKYAELMKQRAKVVKEASGKLAKRLYSGKNSSDLQFDITVSELTKKDDDELVSLLKQNPSDETRRAVLKAAVIGERPKAKVLEAASKDPAVSDKVSDYVSFQKEFGAWESRTRKMERALFGDRASA